MIQQIAETDFSVLRRINHGAGDGRGVFAPLDAMQRSEIEARERELHDIGVKTIKRGEDRIVFFRQDMALACDFNGRPYLRGRANGTEEKRGISA